MISNYNDIVIPKIADYIHFMLERIEATADSTKSITLTKYVKVDSSQLDINYLAAHQLTGVFTVQFHFRIEEEDGTVNEDVQVLEIPRQINNVFVIEGALRIPTNTLENDNQVTVYSNNIRINDLLNITYEEDPTQDGGYLITASYYDDDEPKVMNMTDEIVSRYPQIFTLTWYERDKLKVKLDTDDVGTVLTRELILKLIARGMDKNFDSIIDKRIYSPESNFMSYLWGRDVRKKILTQMKLKFHQYHQIFLRDIQNAVTRYFKIASEKNIDIPSTVNPLVFDAMKYKIRMSKNVAYNRSMVDVIDIVNTPINQNVNQINELNVCIDIKDDILYIKAYKYPTQEMVEVPYVTYCTKKVLLNNSWDYEKKEFKPGMYGEIMYKLRLHEYKLKNYGDKGDNEFDYIEPMPDDKLSVTSRRIPMGNMSDSVRLSMGTGMIKQAVELAHSEPSLISAGHDDEDYVLSTMCTKYQEPSGTVTAIKNNKVFIKGDDGSVTFYEIPNPSVGMNDSLISYTAAVKVGDKIKKGDVIVNTFTQRRKSYELGVNANVIYMNYLGRLHEDGQCISESFAKKLTHFSIINSSIQLYPDDIIKYIKKVGERVKSKDVLVNNQTRLRVSQTMKEAYVDGGGLLTGLGISYSQNNLITPNNCDEGYILDVRIELRNGQKMTSEYSTKTIDEFTQDYNKVKQFPDIVPELYRNQKAEEVELNEKAIGYISYKILRVDRAIVGAKTTGRYGGKGMISLILPDKLMPRIVHEDGSETIADLLLNPPGVLHRKNLSQMYEAALGKCIQEIYRRVCKMISDGETAKIKPFLKEFYGEQFESMSDEELTKNHQEKGIYAYQMKVGFFSKVDYNTVEKWMKDLNLTEDDRIFCPDLTIYEDKVKGLSACAPEEYKSEWGGDPHTYELGYLDNRCVTGNEYIMKLFHTASYSAKVTSEIMDTYEPILGKSRYREGGQNIGK